MVGELRGPAESRAADRDGRYLRQSRGSLKPKRRSTRIARRRTFAHVNAHGQGTPLPPDGLRPGQLGVVLLGR